MGYSPWGRKESDMTERLNTHRHTQENAGVAALSQIRVVALGEHEVTSWCSCLLTGLVVTGGEIRLLPQEVSLLCNITN